MEKPKYKIGQKVFFVESYTTYNKKIPCPMCFGKRFVTIILGDNSHEKIECGFCSHGYEFASSYATVWEPHAEIEEAVISGIEKNNGWLYKVGFTQKFESELYLSKDDAIIEKDKQLEDVTIRAKQYFIDNFIQAKKNQVWSTGYHKGKIKKCEKQIEWHKIRLGMIKDKEKE